MDPRELLRVCTMIQLALEFLAIPFLVERAASELGSLL
jgi:hypothetical protein